VKAKNLKAVYKAFYPTPLEEAAAVESFYIKRGENLVKLFSTFDDESIKVLFSGQRGTGKTTELNYTGTALASKYTILNLKIGKFLSTPRSDSRDILKAIVGAAAGQHPKFQALWDGVYDKAAFEWRDYISIINDTFDEIAKETGKSVLLFIDDLDKGIHQIEDILAEEGDIFAGISCSLALVVPITTIYSPRITKIREWFPHAEVLPVIPLFTKNGERNIPGWDMLKELVFRRMEPGLISGEALELAAAYSGGVFRYLVKLIQESAFNALQSGEDCISESSVRSSIKNMQSEFGRIIGMDDYDTLKEIHSKKNLINIKTDVRFIENDIVLEYQDGSRWVDIHPLVRDLLPGD
jgi:Cdc6-like AAA superfamily ATPase